MRGRYPPLCQRCTDIYRSRFSNVWNENDRLSRVWLVDFFHVHSEDSLRRSDVGTDFSKNRKNKKEKGDRNKRRGNTRIRDYQPSNGKVCSSLENKLSSGGWWNDSEFWDVSTKWSLRSKTSFPLPWTDAPDVAILWCPLSLSLSRRCNPLYLLFKCLDTSWRTNKREFFPIFGSWFELSLPPSRSRAKFQPIRDPVNTSRELSSSRKLRSAISLYTSPLEHYPKDVTTDITSATNNDFIYVKRKKKHRVYVVETKYVEFYSKGRKKKEDWVESGSKDLDIRDIAERGERRRRGG